MARTENHIAAELYSHISTGDNLSEPEKILNGNLLSGAGQLYQSATSRSAAIERAISYLVQIDRAESLTHSHIENISTKANEVLAQLKSTDSDHNIAVVLAVASSVGNQIEYRIDQAMNASDAVHNRNEN